MSRLKSISSPQSNAGQKNNAPINTQSRGLQSSRAICFEGFVIGPQWDEDTQRFLPGISPQDCISIGACNGTDDWADIFIEPNFNFQVVQNVAINYFPVAIRTASRLLNFLTTSG